MNNYLSATGKILHLKYLPSCEAMHSISDRFHSIFRKTFLQESLPNRQKALLKQYGFECDCPACKHNYPAKMSVDDTLRIDKTQSIDGDIMENWRKIENDFDNRTQDKIAGIIAKNKLLLEISGSKFIK